MDPILINKYIEKQREYIYDLLNKNIMLEARVAVLELKVQELSEEVKKQPDS